MRSGYRTFVAWARRGEAERARLNLARMQAAFLDGLPAPEDASLTFAHASLRDGFIAPHLKLAVLPEHRLLRRRRAAGRSGPQTGAIASFTDLRAGSPVVHEDHGIARFTGFETKTVGGVTRDYPSSSSSTATASSCRATRSTRSAATSAPTPRPTARSSAASNGSR